MIGKKKSFREGVDKKGLKPLITITENIAGRIKRVRFEIDDYVFLDREINLNNLEKYGPVVGWPNDLTADEEAIKWLAMHYWSVDLNDMPLRVSGESI